MPVIVVGADTAIGSKIVDALLDPGREIRVFVSDEDVAARMKEKGAKVALGDVSDDSHIQAAATRCFSAILVTEAARDARERSFAADEQKVLESWASAVADVQRVIWVYDGVPPDVDAPEVAVVPTSDADLVDRVVSLDEVRHL